MGAHKVPLTPGSVRIRHQPTMGTRTRGTTPGARASVNLAVTPRTEPSVTIMRGVGRERICHLILGPLPLCSPLRQVPATTLKPTHPTSHQGHWAFVRSQWAPKTCPANRSSRIPNDTRLGVRRSSAKQDCEESRRTKRPHTTERGPRRIQGSSSALRAEIQPLLPLCRSP